ncbi:MAG: ankyrin repeat domain-containing protein [Syntrophorhabdales bacterium]
MDAYERDFNRLQPFARLMNYALGMAIVQADPAVLRYSLGSGADIAYYEQCNGFTPLHSLCNLYNRNENEKNQERLEIAAALIAAGANVNAIHNGLTPLYLAASYGDYDMVKFLLEHDAFVNVADPSTHEKILCPPISHGYIDVVSLLLDAGAELDDLEPQHHMDAHMFCELCLQGETLTDALQLVDDAAISRSTDKDIF